MWIFSFRYFLSNSLALLALLSFSCGPKRSYKGVAVEGITSRGDLPPAHVQRAWDARYVYDEERRLLVPEYAGSRWGAVQQFKEDGNLEYQDWWIRDVRSEDLEAIPDTAITTFVNDEGNVTIIPEKTDEKVEEGATEESLDPDESKKNTDLPTLNDEADPFVPSPFSPF